MKAKIKGVDVSVSKGYTSVCFFRIADDQEIDRDPHTHVMVSNASVLRAQRAQVSVMRARVAMLTQDANGVQHG